MIEEMKTDADRLVLVLIMKTKFLIVIVKMNFVLNFWFQLIKKIKLFQFNYIHFFYEKLFLTIYIFISLIIKLIDSLMSKSKSVKFSLIEAVICLSTDSPVKKIFSLLNQLIFTVESVNFHWPNQWKIFSTRELVNFRCSNQRNLIDSQ